MRLNNTLLRLIHLIIRIDYLWWHDIFFFLTHLDLSNMFIIYASKALQSFLRTYFDYG